MTAEVDSKRGAVKLHQTLKVHEGTISGICFSCDGAWMATGGYDRKIHLWRYLQEAAADVQGPAVLQRCHFPGGWVKHQTISTDAEVSSIAFSRDSTSLVFGECSREAQVWQLQDKNQWKFSSALSHNEWVNSVAFSSSGTMIATGSGNYVWIWCLESPGTWVRKGLAGHEGSVTTVQFCPASDEHVASGSHDGTVRLWMVSDGTSVTLMAHSRSVRSITFSRNGSMIASGGCDNATKVYDLVSNTEHLPLTAHTDCVNCVVFSLDGVLASAGKDGETHFWVPWAPLTCLATTPSSVITAAAFSPDGSTFAFSSGDCVNMSLYNRPNPDTRIPTCFPSALRFRSHDECWFALSSGREITVSALHSEERDLKKLSLPASSIVMVIVFSSCTKIALRSHRVALTGLFWCGTLLRTIVNVNQYRTGKAFQVPCFRWDFPKLAIS
jgi:WD40 repeat protein